MAEVEVVKKPLTRAQVKRQLEKKAIEAINVFIENYFDLPENDNAKQEENENKLIETLLDIYDPEEPNVPIA